MKWLACVLLALTATLAEAQSLHQDQLAQVDYVQRLGERIPLGLDFRDERDAPVRLGSFFGERPVILAMAYASCPNLCGVVLNGLMEGVRGLRQDAGKGFEIVVVSIDPDETAAAAANKKETYVKRYARPGTEPGWHFLRGSAESIRQLSEAIGFHYVYEPETRQYAHASGIAVLTPEGQISRYFLGIEYPPKELNAALTEAGNKRVGGLAQRLLLLCFHYDPMTGKYSLMITRVMQAAGLGTVALLAGLIVWLARRKPVEAAPSSLAALAFLPVRASNMAGSVDALFYALLAVCGLVTAGVFVAVIYFCIRYRAGAKVERGPGTPRPLWLELGWTGATLVIFLAIFVWAAVIYFRMARPPANATEIQVVAKQWMWKAQHANGRREINELHLVVNEPVKLTMTSQDVIHDFFVPAFRTKQDVLPSRYTTEWFTPTRPGDYRLFCAEYCGTDHSHMGGWVHVLEPAAYARWLAEQPEAESLAAAGARLFTARGCSGCHAPNAAVRAPLLEGIYGKPVPLSDGRVVIADEQYLHDSILLPNKQISAGYAPLMPTFQGQLSEEEVMQIVAYLKTLGGPR